MVHLTRIQHPHPNAADVPGQAMWPTGSSIVTALNSLLCLWFPPGGRGAAVGLLGHFPVGGPRSELPPVWSEAKVQPWGQEGWAV